MRLFRRFSQHLLRFFLPWACAGCRAALDGLEDEGFCGRCWMRLPRIEGLVCRSCGLPLKDGGASCYSCRRTPVRLLVRAATRFEGPIRTAIHRFKYAGRQSLARPFAVLMEGAWERYTELRPADALVPVPLHSRHARERGFNQAHLLAVELSHRIGLPAWGQALERCRSTAPQFRLRREERMDNVREAFALYDLVATQRLVSGKSLILIDDVCTTASTLEECARPLLRAGARDVKALVLARDL